MTQEQLAKVLGITRSALSNYEIGNREPDFEITKKLASFFEVSVDYLVGSGETKEVKDSGMAFYGGGRDWTDEEIEIADALIQKLREQKEAKTKKNEKDVK